jgi:transcriptional regulator with XRE-family HTH domain
MLTRDSLGAVLRILRSARKLKVDDFADCIDPKHVNNLENGKSSVTLETLESVAHVLTVNPLSLLILSASLRDGRSPEELLIELKEDVRELRALGVNDGFSGQFEDGKLTVRRPGTQIDQQKLTAIIACKVEGMTQSEAAKKLGIPLSTIRRYWVKG